MSEQSVSTNTFGVARWVVSADATQGTHTTIASAMASASPGDTIFIRDGTYTENVTLEAGVNLAALDGDGDTPNVTIIGKLTYSSAGTVSISGIRLQTNADFFLVVSGAVASIVTLKSCYLNCANNTGISFTSSNATSLINIQYCNGSIGALGSAIFASSSAGTINIFYTSLGNSIMSTQACTITAGGLNLYASNLGSEIVTSGTASIGIFYTYISTAAFNAIALTIGGSGTNSIYSCVVLSGTASSISISSSAAINNTFISSSNAAAITGGGTINYACLTFGNSPAINVTTQTIAGTIQGSTTTAPTPGFLGQRIVSVIAELAALPLTTVTPINVTSISLSAGVWDVSGSIGFTGATTGTSFEGAVTQASLGSGSLGDSAAATPYPPTASQDVTLTVAPVRFVFTTTTAVYLTAVATFSAGAPGAYGRISAVRVG